MFRFENLVNITHLVLHIFRDSNTRVYRWEFSISTDDLSLPHKNCEKIVPERGSSSKILPHGNLKGSVVSSTALSDAFHRLVVFDCRRQNTFTLIFSKLLERVPGDLQQMWKGKVSNNVVKSNVTVQCVFQVSYCSNRCKDKSAEKHKPVCEAFTVIQNYRKKYILARSQEVD